MVLSSVCIDSAVDWTQSFLQNSALNLSEDMIACPRPPMDRRMKPQVPDQALKCPRCDSTNTKFCYYNNYNLSQPRHFCKTCRRYWTKGGALRNVPVGGGCRKNKRAKRTIDHPVSEAPSTSAPPASSNEADIANRSPFDQITLPGSSSNPVYYGGNTTSLAFTRAQQDGRLGDGVPVTSALANCNNSSDVLGISTCVTHQSSLDPQLGTSSLAPNCLAALSALNTLNSLKSNYPGLDFSGSSRELSSYFQTTSQMLRSADYVPVFGVDHGVGNPWKLQRQLAVPFEEGPATEEHAFLPFEDHTAEDSKDQKSEVVTCLPSSVKVEEEDQVASSEWQVASEPALFETAGDSGNYWTRGPWPELASYGSSGSPLI